MLRMMEKLAGIALLIFFVLCSFAYIKFLLSFSDCDVSIPPHRRT
jgi:hypothetical protein